MTDQKPTVVYAASYDSVSAAEADLDAIDQLHKDQMIGSVRRGRDRQEGRQTSRRQAVGATWDAATQTVLDFIKRFT